MHVGQAAGHGWHVRLTGSPNNPEPQFVTHNLDGINAKYGDGHYYTHNLPTSNLYPDVVIGQL